MHVLEKHVVWKGLLEKSAPQRYNSIEFSYPANVRIGLIRRMEAVKRIQLPCGLLFPPLQSYAGRGQQLESYLYATHLTMITSISLLSVTKTLSMATITPGPSSQRTFSIRLSVPHCTSFPLVQAGGSIPGYDITGNNKKEAC